jgi:hypothetical protein
MMPDAKMPRAPGNLLPERHHPARHPGDRALACISSRCDVEIYAARKIKHALNGSAYLSAEFDHGHDVAEATMIT